MKYRFQRTLTHGEFRVSEFFNRIPAKAAAGLVALHGAEIDPLRTFVNDLRKRHTTSHYTHIGKHFFIGPAYNQTV